MRHKRLIIIFGVLVVGAVIALKIYISLFTGALVTVNAPDDASIYISTEQGGEQKQVGTGSVVFRFRETPATLYVIAKSESNQAISASVVENNDQVVTLDLTFTEQKQTSLYFEGAVRDGIVRGTSVQGIEPFSESIVNFDTERFVSLRPAFIGVPFLRHIEWVDENNFIYLSYQSGAGSFINGKKLPNAQFGGRIIDQNGQTIAESEGGEITNISKQIESIASSGNTVYLLTNTSVYETKDLGRTLRKILDVNASSLNGSIVVNNGFLYYLSSETPSVTATEADSNLDEHKEHSHGSVVSIYKLNGEKQGDVEVDGNVLVGAFTSNQNSCMLTNQELVCAIEGTTTILPLYTRDVSDIVSVSGSTYILAGSSLWRVAENADYLQQVTTFEAHGVAVRDSLTVTGPTLYFGVIPTDNTGTNSKTLQLNL